MKQKALIAAVAVLFITVSIALRVRENRILRHLSEDKYLEKGIRILESMHAKINTFLSKISG